MDTKIERLNLRIEKLTEKLALEQKRTPTLKYEAKKMYNTERIAKYQSTLQILNEKLAKAQEKLDYQQKNVCGHCDVCNKMYKRIMTHNKSKKHLDTQEKKRIQMEEKQKKIDEQVRLYDENIAMKETIENGQIPEFSDLYKFILVQGVNKVQGDNIVKRQYVQERIDIVIQNQGFTDQAIYELVTHDLQMMVNQAVQNKKTRLEDEIWYLEHWRPLNIRHIKEYQLKQGCFSKQDVAKFNELMGELRSD